jgi:hypothetical protein
MAEILALPKSNRSKTNTIKKYSNIIESKINLIKSDIKEIFNFSFLDLKKILRWYFIPTGPAAKLINIKKVKY